MLPLFVLWVCGPTSRHHAQYRSASIAPVTPPISTTRLTGACSIHASRCRNSSVRRLMSVLPSISLAVRIRASSSPDAPSCRRFARNSTGLPVT